MTGEQHAGHFAASFANGKETKKKASEAGRNGGQR
jgi:hypothetical protein